MIGYEVIICRISPSHLISSRRTCVEQRVNGRVPSVFPNDLLILYPATPPRPQSSSPNSACRCKVQLLLSSSSLSAKCWLEVASLVGGYIVVMKGVSQLSLQWGVSVTRQYLSICLIISCFIYRIRSMLGWISCNHMHGFTSSFQENKVQTWTKYEVLMFLLKSIWYLKNLEIYNKKMSDVQILWLDHIFL